MRISKIEVRVRAQADNGIVYMSKHAADILGVEGYFSGEEEINRILLEAESSAWSRIEQHCGPLPDRSGGLLVGMTTMTARPEDRCQYQYSATGEFCNSKKAENSDHFCEVHHRLTRQSA